jgi:hypothetical protein
MTPSIEVKDGLLSAAPLSIGEKQENIVKGACGISRIL